MWVVSARVVSARAVGACGGAERVVVVVLVRSQPAGSPTARAPGGLRSESLMSTLSIAQLLYGRVGRYDRAELVRTYMRGIVGSGVQVGSDAWFKYRINGL